MNKLNWRALIQRQPQWLWPVAVVVLSLALAAIWPSSSTPKDLDEKGHLTSPDTYIPPGFVLVPIELKNSESLDQLLGQYGVVNLYTAEDVERGRPSRLLVQGIRILRSPLNSNVFAVLAPENQAANIVKHDGAFQVSIQNPKHNGTNFVNPQGKRIRPIIVEDE